MGANSAHAGSGQVTLVDCTLTNNISQGGYVAYPPPPPGGSALYNLDGTAGSALYNLDGTATLTNDTLVGTLGGSLVSNAAWGNDIATGNPVQATLVLNNCILASSNEPFALGSSAGYGQGANTATVSGSHNLVTSSAGTIGAGVIALTADPMLGPLQNNGGLTPTMMPLRGSPVLGAGDPSLAPATDQRGVPRPANGPTDLGAVQVSVPSTSRGSNAGPGTTAPPSLFQALLSLYLDGAVLELNNLAVEFIHGDDFNIDNYFGTPDQLAIVRANAAAAGINYDAIEPWIVGLERFTGRTALNSVEDLHFNFPYGGPFALFAIAAGSQAADQAVHLWSPVRPKIGDPLAAQQLWEGNRVQGYDHLRKIR